MSEQASERSGNARSAITEQESRDSDRRRLLSDNDSIAPSDSISVADDVTELGERTPRATSPARSQSTIALQRSETNSTVTTSRPYRGFASEAEYMEALRAWAATKQYVEHDTSLVGFYGETTMEDYSNRPQLEKVDFGIRRMLRERKQKKNAAREVRRNTVV